MPRNILHSLYNGDFKAWERQPVRTPESIAVSRKIEAENRYFMEKMSLDDCQRLQALESLYHSSSHFEQMDAFSYGFKLGTILMCAVYLDDGEPQCNE